MTEIEKDPYKEYRTLHKNCKFCTYRRTNYYSFFDYRCDIKDTNIISNSLAKFCKYYKIKI